jgi:hypothetical protein
MNLDGWCAQDAQDSPRVLSVGGNQSSILRWDLSRYSGRQVDGPGVLELVTHSVERLARPV